MSFAGYCAVITKASRWWRRSRTLQITLWPNWLAQRLCPHVNKLSISPDPDVWRCGDCFKFNFTYASAHRLTEQGMKDGSFDEPKEL